MISIGEVSYVSEVLDATTSCLHLIWKYELDSQFDDAQIINVGFSDLFGRKKSRFLSRMVRLRQYG